MSRLRLGESHRCEQLLCSGLNGTGVDVDLRKGLSDLRACWSRHREHPCTSAHLVLGQLAFAESLRDDSDSRHGNLLLLRIDGVVQSVADLGAMVVELLLGVKREAGEAVGEAGLGQLGADAQASGAHLWLMREKVPSVVCTKFPISSTPRTVQALAKVKTASARSESAVYEVERNGFSYSPSEKNADHRSSQDCRRRGRTR